MIDLASSQQQPESFDWLRFFLSDDMAAPGFDRPVGAFGGENHMDEAGKAAGWFFEHTRAARHGSDGNARTVGNVALRDVSLQVLDDLPTTRHRGKFCRCTQIVQKRIQQVAIRGGKFEQVDQFFVPGRIAFHMYYCTSVLVQ